MKKVIFRKLNTACILRFIGMDWKTPHLLKKEKIIEQMNLHSSCQLSDTSVCQTKCVGESIRVHHLSVLYLSVICFGCDTYICIYV